MISDRRPPYRFAYRTRVGFDETDAQGIVYYGRYMPYFDRARVEYQRHLDLLERDHSGPQFVMRAQHVEYHAPARFDDLLEVFARISRLGRTSVTYDLCATRLPDDALMVTATQTVVLISRETRRPVPIPDAAREPIRAFEGADLVE